MGMPSVRYDYSVVAPPPAYGPKTVVELGAHSLKIHRLSGGTIRTVKYPYALGHEVYATGCVHDDTAREIVRFASSEVTQPAVAIGTSAVREARNRGSFVRFLEQELGFGLHVLSCWEEAGLLAEGYLTLSERVPALLADLGGGSLEIVYISENRSILWDSLPLGAIRLYRRGLVGGRGAQLECIHRRLSTATLVQSGTIYLTGGTGAALAKTLRTPLVSLAEIDALEREVRRHGPPALLRPPRAQVFQSGLLLLRRLMEFADADKLLYVKISVGRMFLSLARRSVRPWRN